MVDGTHNKLFTKEKITVFLSRVPDRGYTIKFMGGDPNLFGEGFRALSFTVMLPGNLYDQAEADMIEGFVNKGASSYS